MTRYIVGCRIASGLMLGALISAVLLPAESVAANKDGQAFKKPIRNPKFDPSADQVDLFDAMEAGQITVKLIPKGATGGNVFIENKTDQPLTVKIPEAVAAVSIHSQFAGLPGLNLGNAGAGIPGGGNQGNAPQKLGGGIGAPQGNNPGAVNGPGNGLVPGQGFFSIPADKVVALQFNSVCLEHGKPEPISKNRYTLIPIGRVSRDPVLHQLLIAVGSGKLDSKASQAAAWHLANKMSFKELSEKTTTPIGAVTQTPDFTREQIVNAEQLVVQARQRANERDVANRTVEETTADSVDEESVRVAKK
jgi:hypothetical protein